MTNESLSSRQVNALFERGNNFLRMNNFKAAVKDYSTVIENQPQFAPAHYNRGLAQLHLGDFRAAIQGFDQAIALTPNFPEAFASRAIAYHQVEAYHEAIESYTAALALNPQLSHVYSNRGEAYFIIGQYKNAAADFRQAERLKPGYRYAIAGLAVCEHALGDVFAAKQRWATLVARNDQFRSADWVGAELGWHPALIDEAAKLLGKA